MRLPVMADQLIDMYQSGELDVLTINEVLDRMVTTEYYKRQSNTIERYRKAAKLSEKTAELSDIQFASDKNVDMNLIKQLSDDILSIIEIY